MTTIQITVCDTGIESHTWLAYVNDTPENDLAQYGESIADALQKLMGELVKRFEPVNKAALHAEFNMTRKPEKWPVIMWQDFINSVAKRASTQDEAKRQIEQLLVSFE